MSDTKTCTICGETKKLEEFKPHKNGKYGVHSQCKPCQKEYRKTQYLKAKEAKNKIIDRIQDSVVESFEVYLEYAFSELDYDEQILTLDESIERCRLITELLHEKKKMLLRIKRCCQIYLTMNWLI